MENENHVVLLVEELKINIRGKDDPDNYFLLFAYEMRLKPESKKIAIPIHPEDIHKAFAYYLKKKGVMTNYTKHKLFKVIKAHCPSKLTRIKKSWKTGKGGAMTPLKLVNTFSYIFDFLREIDSVVE